MLCGVRRQVASVKTHELIEVADQVMVGQPVIDDGVTALAQIVIAYDPLKEPVACAFNRKDVDVGIQAALDHFQGKIVAFGSGEWIKAPG